MRQLPPRKIWIPMAVALGMVAGCACGSEESGQSSSRDKAAAEKPPDKEESTVSKSAKKKKKKKKRKKSKDKKKSDEVAAKTDLAPPAAAAGIWHGTFKSRGYTGRVTGIVLADSEARFVSHANGVQFVGRLNSTASRVDGTLIARAPRVPAYEYTIDADHKKHSKLNGTFKSDIDKGKFKLDYRPESSRAGDVESLAGRWGRGGFGMQLDDKGKITGNDRLGCAYAGNIEAVHPDLNGYRIKLDVTGCRYKGSYTGHAAVVDHKSKNDRMIYGLSSNKHAHAGHLKRGAGADGKGDALVWVGGAETRKDLEDSRKDLKKTRRDLKKTRRDILKGLGR